MIKKFILGLIVVFCLLPDFVISQASKDSISGKKSVISVESSGSKQAVLTPYHWNVIKINPTPMLLWGGIKNFTLSYERLIRKNQSLSIQAGFLSLPRLLPDTVLGIVAVKSFNKFGVNLAFDYRYYPSLRNRRPAPDGIYLGSYLSYYGYQFKNGLDLLATSDPEEGTLKGKLEMLNLGLDLGYQFIFWKRFSVDLLLFGPSVTWYRTGLEVTGNLDPSQIEGLDQEVLDELIATFPMLQYLFREHAFSYSSASLRTSFSFRYSIQLGFHF